jgi:hypothetical protein
MKNRYLILQNGRPKLTSSLGLIEPMVQKHGESLPLSLAEPAVNMVLHTIPVV